jgi:glycosyltransferase involved in cell wall biosynthesis
MEVFTVPYGIDLDRFHPAGPTVDLDALSGLQPAAPRTVRIGLVATFAHWKGHRVFLEALAALPESTAVRGYVIGGSIYRTVGSQLSSEQLQNEGVRLGLAGRVGFTGFCTDISRVMRSLDVIVHASTQPEPFGLVIVEAMACSKPVIVAASGGAAEIVSPGLNAVCHTPGAVHELADHMIQLAADPALRERLGAEGRKTAERHYARSRMAAELIPIYLAARNRTCPEQRPICYS